MSRLKIFIDGKQFHDFDFKEVAGIEYAEARIPLSRVTVKLKDGGKYSFYTMDAQKLSEVKMEVAKAQVNAEHQDVELWLELKNNPKYQQPIAEADPDAPRLQAFVGDRLVFDALLTDVRPPSASGKGGEGTITVHVRNPDLFVDGAELDTRDNDFKYTFVATSGDVFAKLGELDLKAAGTASATIHFDGEADLGQKYATTF